MSNKEQIDAKVILVIRKTQFQELVAQYNTEDQARFVIESRGSDFNNFQIEHEIYMASIDTVVAELKRSARVQILDREFLTNFIFGPNDIIVVLGQDGLVANTLKYLNGQPVIAINPDPQRFDGILLPFVIRDIEKVFADVQKRQYNSKKITIAKAELNDGQELTAVNDIFIGPRYQTSARYQLTVDGHEEIQSSSGIILSTGLGSTGWLKSVVTGAKGVLGHTSHYESGFAWDTDKLKFAVREPFPSQSTGTNLIFGEITTSTIMKVASLMAGNGVIFSDGMVDDYIEFNSGAIAQLKVSSKKGMLVV